MAKCGGCGRFLSSPDGAKCSKCLGVYHRSCVNIPAKDTASPDWCCPECKRKSAPKKRNDDTPVRGPQSEKDKDALGGFTATAAPESEHAAAALEGVSGSEEFLLLMEEIKAMRSDFGAFRRHMEIEMAAIRVSVQTCSSRLDNFEARLLAVEEMRSASAPEVDGSIEGLRRELNDRDQELLGNDVEVSNIPEVSGENPAHLARTIGTLLGVAVEDRDIVSAERVGRRQLVATSPLGASERRPRVLVVRLARRDTRDELLRAARARRGATTQDLGVGGGPRRFYVNERLTKANRQLFRRTREAAGEAGWRFVWTKRGQILACRKPGDPTHRIRAEADLSNRSQQVEIRMRDGSSLVSPPRLVSRGVPQGSLIGPLLFILYSADITNCFHHYA